MVRRSVLYIIYLSITNKIDEHWIYTSENLVKGRAF